MSYAWSAHLKPSQSAALAHQARLGEDEQRGQDALRELSFLAGESINEIRAVGVVLPHIVVVDCLLDQLSGPDERVDCRGRGIGHPEERFAVDFADDLPADFDRRVRPDHLKVEHVSSRTDSPNHVAQDVHDVLRVDASERPGEDDEIERVRFELDLLP